MILLEGKSIAKAWRADLKARVQHLMESGVRLKLVVLLVGDDPASRLYVNYKRKAAKAIGIDFELRHYPKGMSQEALIAVVEDLNADPSVTGFIIQLPLPKHFDTPGVIKAVDPYKDVDGFHAYNLGKLLVSRDFEGLAASTPKGIIKMLDHYKIDVEGKHAVVVGRSMIVGKPIASMLTNRNATVTLCHSRTKDLFEHTKRADLIIMAVGQPQILKAEHIKEGAVVVDVGINRLPDDRVVGDVDFEDVKDKVSAITPVPGGVGPMTVMGLLENVWVAYQKQL